jgi:hypothetical protein
VSKIVTVAQVVDVLDQITGGRVIKSLDEISSTRNPFVVMKSSNIPGKDVIEIPGLVYGDPEKEVKKIAVLMTLTESAIELAGATCVDVIIAHHPVADAANSGGVTLKSYLSLYDIAVIELHEAFHGLHRGIAYLHGHQPEKVDIAYGGIPGNIMSIGQPLPEIKTIGDIIKRLNEFLGVEVEQQMLNREQQVRKCREIVETNVVTGGKIILGEANSKVSKILHIHPHTGFTPQHLEKAIAENPEIDTVLASISRVYDGHPLIAKAQELNLNFVVGNSHSVEIYENGMPLGYAIQKYLPEVEVVLFRERMTSTPITKAGAIQIQEYAQYIADTYLFKKAVKSSVAK